MTTLKDFKFIVECIRSNTQNTLVVTFLLNVNKRLFELAKLIEDKHGSTPLIKVMQHCDLTMDVCNDKCFLCMEKTKTKIVLPSDHGLLSGFYVCDGECMDLILHVYNLAHFEKQAVINENTNKFYAIYLKDMECLNDLINSLL